MRARVLADLALSNSLAREVKKPNISEIEIENARTLIEILLRYSLADRVDTEDLYLERDIVSFICLNFILAVFFAGLSSVDTIFLYLIDGLRDEDRVSENFLLSLLLLVFLLLVFSLLVLVIIAILAALESDIFLEKAPV